MKKLLEPAYQPIYDLQRGEVSHYEALARIRGDETDRGHGPLIELAERHHFIDRVDLTMFELVLDAAAHHEHVIAVNLSPFTVHKALHDVMTLLDAHRHLAHRLILEITETLPVRDVERMRQFIALVHQYGGRVAFDDYGNGKGCFTEDLVLELRPDFLKLDGTVLKRAVFFDDTRELELAVAMVRRFSGHLIAEFVDSTAKIEYLRSVGVRYAQGAAYGMPRRQSSMPARRAATSSGQIAAASA